MGFAAVIASPVASSLIQQQDAFFAFRTIGLVYIVVIICSIFFIKAAPTGYQPAGWKAPVQTKQGPTNKTGNKCYKVLCFTLSLACFCRRLFWFDDCLSSITNRSINVWTLCRHFSSLCISLFNRKL